MEKTQEEYLKDIDFIEKYYPPYFQLTDLELLIRGKFDSLHEYQLYIAKVRAGQITLDFDEIHGLIEMITE